MLGPIVAFFVSVFLPFWIAGQVGIVPSLSSLGSGSDTGSSSSSGSGRSSSSDSRAILREAKKFDSKAYIWGGGHPPTERVVRQGVDCSGLITVAVLRATGINDDRLAEGFRRSPHWKKISFREAGPGDILYRLIATHGGSTDHVVIVVDNKGNGKLTVFEAYGSRDIPHSKQIRQSGGHKYKEYTGALRFRR